MNVLRIAGLAAMLALPLAAPADEPGRKVFTEIAQPPCAVCHTLEDAGATGEIGPSLDELKPDRARVLEVLKTGVGVMPRYADLLTPQQIDAVADYVAKAAGGS